MRRQSGLWDSWAGGRVAGRGARVWGWIGGGSPALSSKRVKRVVVVVVDAITNPVCHHLRQRPDPLRSRDQDGTRCQRLIHSRPLGTSVTSESGPPPTGSIIFWSANSPGLCCTTRGCQSGRSSHPGCVNAAVPGVGLAKQLDPVALHPRPEYRSPPFESRRPGGDVVVA